MVPCPSCDRHIRTTDETCPFCEAPRGPSALQRARSAAGVALAAFVLSACYGTGVTVDKSTTIPTGDTGDTTTTTTTTP